MIKQKTDWGSIVSPVKKLSDLLQTFNTMSNKTLILSGMDLSGSELPMCKDKIQEKDKFKTLKLKNDSNVVVSKILNPCVDKDPSGNLILRVELNLFGFDKQITDLITKSEDDILNKLDLAVDRDKKFVEIFLGKEFNKDKKEILDYLSTFIRQQYEKTSKDKLNQKEIGEISVIESENKRFLEVLDLSKYKVDSLLCDASDIEITNSFTVSNIKSFTKDGDKFCIDVDTEKFYQQKRVLTLGNASTEKKSVRFHPIAIAQDSSKNKMDEDPMKMQALDSYVANYLTNVYTDPKKWTLEWVRVKDSILLKLSKENEIIFHKFDASNAVEKKGTCPDFKITPNVKEFIYVDRSCKKMDKVKLDLLVVGSEHSEIVGLKVGIAKLEETKTVEDFEKFRDQFGKFDKAYYYITPYSGLYGNGLYSSGIYSYPYSYSGVYNPYYGTYYLPPVSSSIIPTAPVVSPYTYSYTYPTLGTYNAPYVYSPYSYYSYASPYSYYIIKNHWNNVESKHVLDHFDEFRPKRQMVKKFGSISELKNELVRNRMTDIQVEKISDQKIKVSFEKHSLRQSQIYGFDGNGLYFIQ
jgi:hypothetical protein